MVLVAPEIPGNTGCIGRTCIGAEATLHLVKPLGFSIEDREVKRAGLDYWHKINLKLWDNFDAFLQDMAPQPDEVALFTKKGAQPFWSLPPLKRLFLVFGSETKGLPAPLLAQYQKSTYRIPISGDIRSLNLSTAVGIALYESLRYL